MAAEMSFDVIITFLIYLKYFSMGNLEWYMHNYVVLAFVTLNTLSINLVAVI